MKYIFLFVLFTRLLLAQTQLTGIIKPIHDIKLSVSVDALVKEILVHEGDKVKKGELLLQFDDSLQALETKRRELIYNEHSKIDSLRKNLAIMKQLLDSKESLYKRTKAISLNELNHLKMQYINMESDYLIAQEEKKREQVEYEIANHVLKLYSLKAPISGTIISIKADIGENLQTGKEIIELVNSDRCFVELDVKHEVMLALKKSSKIVVQTIYKEATVEKKGNIDFISTIADSASGLVRVKISFDNYDSTILPGLTAYIIFE